MDIRSSRSALVLLTTGLFPALALAGLGCHPEPEWAADPGAMASKPGEVAGKLIFSKTLGPRHLVEFFEFEGGAAGVREALDADAGEPVFGERAAPVSTLSEAFRTLEPEAKVVPAALLDADRRAREKRLTMATRATSSPPVAPETRAAESDVEMTSQALVFCSIDALGDKWSRPSSCRSNARAGGIAGASTT